MKGPCEIVHSVTGEGRARKLPFICIHVFSLFHGFLHRNGFLHWVLEADFGVSPQKYIYKVQPLEAESLQQLVGSLFYQEFKTQSRVLARAFSVCVYACVCLCACMTISKAFGKLSGILPSDSNSPVVFPIYFLSIGLPIYPGRRATGVRASPA